MYNHAPDNYICPLCLAVEGVESEDTMMKQDDIFYKDKTVIAAINSKFFENNQGHIIVVPTHHYENLYELPDNVSQDIILLSKKIAIALKEIRQCNGVTILQNNEPASGQHAFHYHMHIIPRFDGDNLYAKMQEAKVSLPKDRVSFSSSMKNYFKNLR